MLYKDWDLLCLIKPTHLIEPGIVNEHPDIRACFRQDLSQFLITAVKGKIQRDGTDVPYLEIVFGPDYEVIPALVLTAAKETFVFVPIGECDAILPVCSGDMLFNVFDEYLGFLSEGE